jgi:signal transduction histidine kinase
MKIFLLVLASILITQCTLAQQPFAGGFTHSDSILLNEIKRETDPLKIRNLTINLMLLSDDKAPLPLMEEAKQIDLLADQKKDTYLKTFAMSMYGQAYRLAGDFTKALQYHYKAIELAKSLKDNSMIGYTLNQSGHIFKDREDVEKSVEIYKESINYSKGADVEVFRFYPYMNLGFVYLNAGNADSAKFYSEKAEEMLRSIMSKENPERKAIMERSLYVYVLSNLGGAYSLMKDKSNADVWYRSAQKIIDLYRGAQTRYFQFYYFNLAKHYKRFNLIDSSLYAAKEAINTVAGTPVGYLASGPAKMLSDYYEKTDADSAVKYLKIFLQGNEVMNSTRVTQQLQMMAVEDEQRTADIEAAAKQSRQRIILYSLIAGLLSVVFFAFYMLRANRIRQRINRELSEQKTQLEHAIGELKSTQAQLVHAEKMASLGELTAGIAHEIQNPLNFVNNFSDVNQELIDELKEELQKGDLREASAIADNLKENESKINLHGKRADGIVKSMLQHSRGSAGLKEPTDVNKLVDEYIRLAFHGYRAKVKDFNVDLDINLDPLAGSAPMVRQDIGRVILNLLNNAFYAVMERAGKADYKPKVSVITKRESNAVLIEIADNGSGIPDDKLAKIFQPFFTTKPTGEGTGLGLSLSYDIITKGHGGSLTCDTKPNEYTKFTITLPSHAS